MGPLLFLILCIASGTPPNWSSATYCICNTGEGLDCNKSCEDLGPVIGTDATSIGLALRNAVVSNISFTIIGTTREKPAQFLSHYFANRSIHILGGNEDDGAGTVEYVEIRNSEFVSEGRFWHVSFKNVVLMFVGAQTMNFAKLDLSNVNVDPKSSEVSIRMASLCVDLLTLQYFAAVGTVHLESPSITCGILCNTAFSHVYVDNVSVGLSGEWGEVVVNIRDLVYEPVRLLLRNSDVRDISIWVEDVEEPLPLHLMVDSVERVSVDVQVSRTVPVTIDVKNATVEVNQQAVNFCRYKGDGRVLSDGQDVVFNEVYCLAEDPKHCQQDTVFFDSSFNTLMAEVRFSCVANNYTLDRLPADRSLFFDRYGSVPVELSISTDVRFESHPLTKQSFQGIDSVYAENVLFGWLEIRKSSFKTGAMAAVIQTDLDSLDQLVGELSCLDLIIDLSDDDGVNITFLPNSTILLCDSSVNNVSVNYTCVNFVILRIASPAICFIIDEDCFSVPDITIELIGSYGTVEFNFSTVSHNHLKLVDERLTIISYDKTVRFWNPFLVPDIISHEVRCTVIGYGVMYLNDWDLRYRLNYCICDHTEGSDCLEKCPLGSSIIPYKDSAIASTVLEDLQPPYLNYFFVDSSSSKRLRFNISHYRHSSLSLAGYNSERVYISLLPQEQETEFPNELVTHSLRNVDAFVENIEHSTALYLNFAGAIFEWVTFNYDPDVTLTIQSYSMDTDILTLASFPSSLIFKSPTRGCNISCGSVIDQIVLLSKQKIMLNGIDINISYTLDLSLLVSTPANISCKLKDETDRLLITFVGSSEAPTSLADIPDLRFDISQTPSQAIHIDFPVDGLPSDLEDVSSRIEIFHDRKDLYLWGRELSSGTHTRPPTIYHSGEGNYYVNGVLSTYKSKYCLCSENLTKDCSKSCATIGPVIPFDEEKITATITRNPTRLITYIVFDTLPEPNCMPCFSMKNLSFKSFMIAGNGNKQEHISIAGFDPGNQIVQLKHSFDNIIFHFEGSIEPYFFYSLELLTTKFYSDEPVLPTVSAVRLIADLQSLIWLQQMKIDPKQTEMEIAGGDTLSTIVLTSRTQVTLIGFTSTESSNRSEVVVDTQGLSGALTITSVYGTSLERQLRIQLPEGKDPDINSIPVLYIDVSQIFGSRAHLLFPENRWTGSLANISSVFSVRHEKLDLYTESSKTDGVYDGRPPFINRIGRGDYYINGEKDTGEWVVPTTPPSSRGLGAGLVAGIVIACLLFIGIVTAVTIVLVRVQKKRSRKLDKDDLARMRDGNTLQAFLSEPL